LIFPTCFISPIYPSFVSWKLKVSELFRKSWYSTLDLGLWDLPGERGLTGHWRHTRVPDVYIVATVLRQE